jgi:hypothetical protein
MMLLVRRSMLALVVSVASWLVPATAAEAAVIWSSWDAAHSGLCLTVKDASTADKAPLIQYHCSNATSQLFTLEPVGSEGAYLIRNYRSQKCLDVRDYSIHNNGVIQQYRCHGETNQQWFKAPVTSLPGYFHFVNRRSWLCINVLRGSILPYADIVQNGCNPGGITSHQSWR